MKYPLIISCVFPPEPTVSGQVMFDVATELAKSGMVKVITPMPTRPFNFLFDEHRVPHHPFEHLLTDSFTSPSMGFMGRYMEGKSFGKWCYDYIAHHHKDISLVYMNAWPLYSQEIIIKATKKYKLPCLTIIQDIYPESLVNKVPIGKGFIQNILLKKDRFILKNSTKVLCISAHMKTYLAKTRNLPLDHFSVVVNWQDENAFIQYFKDRNDTADTRVDKLFTYMYLGNIGPVAGVEFLISCFVKAMVPHSRLIIAGSGSKRKDCENLTKDLNAKNIEFMSVPDGKVPHTQDIADVLLLPVKKNEAYSSIPSKLPAYFFSKKPIIGSLDMDSDTAQAIIDANAGIVVEPEHHEQLVAALQEIALWSAEKLYEKGQNGYLYAMKHFSKSENLKKITQLIGQL